jgi:hypothetical protein
MCVAFPDAARTLVEKDNRFIVVGPALINSEVFVMGQSRKPKRVAYSHKRDYQKKLIQRRFGPDCEPVP